jgi:hypothetical protein
MLALPASFAASEALVETCTTPRAGTMMVGPKTGESGMFMTKKGRREPPLPPPTAALAACPKVSLVLRRNARYVSRE